MSSPGLSTLHAVIHYYDWSTCQLLAKMIKGIQIRDHDIKIVNFADDTTIFLDVNGDAACLNMIQVILKLYENAKIK